MTKIEELRRDLETFTIAPERGAHVGLLGDVTVVRDLDDYTRIPRTLVEKQGDLVRVVGLQPVFTGTAVVTSDRRAIPRIFCGTGGCNLGPAHPGPHSGDCRCLNGCSASECPNL